MAAQKILRDSHIIEKEFLTADLALEKRRSTLRSSTGSWALDELLLGGIETFRKLDDKDLFNICTNK